jgi:hypothetical protein
MENKREFLEITKPLNDQEFRFLIIAILNQPVRTTMHITPNLFSKFISEEDNYTIIAEDITKKLGGIDEVERSVVDSWNKMVADTRQIRKYLKLEPFIDTEHPEIIECAIIEKLSTEGTHST